MKTEARGAIEAIKADRFSEGFPDTHTVHCRCIWLAPPKRIACVCVASLFQEANLLLFTPCSTTRAPFNLHCCSRSLFQSAVVLIASPCRSQLPLLPEKCCRSLNEENRQDVQLTEEERGMAGERMRGRRGTEVRVGDKDGVETEREQRHAFTGMKPF